MYWSVYSVFGRKLQTTSIPSIRATTQQISGDGWNKVFILRIIIYDRTIRNLLYYSDKTLVQVFQVMERFTKIENERVTDLISINVDSVVTNARHIARILTNLCVHLHKTWQEFTFKRRYSAFGLDLSSRRKFAEQIGASLWKSREWWWWRRVLQTPFCPSVSWTRSAAGLTRKTQSGLILRNWKNRCSIGVSQWRKKTKMRH